MLEYTTSVKILCILPASSWSVSHDLSLEIQREASLLFHKISKESSRFYNAKSNRKSLIQVDVTGSGGGGG